MFTALLNNVKNVLSICGQVSLASCASLMKTTYGYAIFKGAKLTRLLTLAFKSLAVALTQSEFIRSTFSVDLTLTEINRQLILL